MNTHRFTFAARNGVGRIALSMLGGIVLMLTLLFSPAVYAASAGATTPSLPTLSPANVLNLAGVSVVRLSLTYSTTQGKTVKTVVCTGLGSLIKSWPAASPTDQNNWVVADGSLLSLQGSSCSGGNLTQIQILANTLYTNSTSRLSLLDTLTCKTAGCQDQASDSTKPVNETLLSPAVGGGVLFSFHTPTPDMQPFLNIPLTQATPASSLGIELAAQTSSSNWPPTPSLTSATQAQNFLTPVSSTSSAPSPASSATPGGASGGAATRFEPGTPFVDGLGNFIGMQVFRSTTLFTLANLQTLESKVPAFTATHTTNLLQQQWDAGITNFDQGNYAAAKADFDSIRTTNPAFQAATNFSQQAAMKLSQSGSLTPTPSLPGSSVGKGSTSSPNTIILVIGLAAGLIFLVLLLVLVSLIFGRRRAARQAERDRFKEEAAAARRKAPLEAQRISEEAQRRRNQPSDDGAPSPYAQAAPPTSPLQMSPAPPFQMSPSAPPLPPAPLAPPPASVPYAPAAAPQPQQEQWQQPQTDSAFADPLDTPTVPINRKNGSGNADSQASEGQLVREFHNVSLAVGSLSNVGLKRQHKPNEDSMFAIQAARTFNSQPQQFGLFVIADGMGGHANGGDASRTAIQTMIDFMLPKISVAEPGMSDQDYLKLLEEGVQRANYAVHQRNLQDHADMGTTMTGAMVIGAMAYVANVGDSRTYLFRHATGLTKVTRDHSVVASLVDAGIIKPDDIYTHPKRNQIYRSLGEKPVVEVDSFPVELQAGDKLLLCSDGLWDLVRDPDIQRIIASTETNPAKTSEELIQAALNGGGDDNVSVIVVSIAEIDGHTGLTGINYLSKPDSVSVPDLPATP